MAADQPPSTGNSNELLPNTPMDEGLDHLPTNRISVTPEKAVGFVRQEEFASLPMPNAQPQAPSAPAQVYSTGLADGVLPERPQIERTSRSLDVSHASPLAPLRARDSRALEDCFEHEHLQAIALDIHRYLARIYPEPCWEDEPFEFLNGYI